MRASGARATSSPAPRPSRPPRLPTTGEAVRAFRAEGRRHVAVAQLFLAPGKLPDRAAELALEAGAVAVAEPLGADPEVARVGHRPLPRGSSGAGPGLTGREAPNRLRAMSDHFNVLVLGAGPGGYVAAIRASQLGLSVGVVEKKYWGGVCLNVGCIPSKALLKNAELAHVLTHEKDLFGIEGDATMSFAATHARSRSVSAGIVKGVHFLMKKNKITEIDGWGTLTGPKSVEVKKADGSTATVHLRQPDHRHRRHHPAHPRHRPVAARRDLRGADPRPRPPRRASSSPARAPSASSSPT